MPDSGHGGRSAQADGREQPVSALELRQIPTKPEACFDFRLKAVSFHSL